MPWRGRSTKVRDRLGPIVPLDGAKPSAWIGTWLRRDATIAIEAGEGFSLSVKGEAICCSDDPKLREDPYTGAIEGLGTAKGSLLRIPDVELTIDEFRFRTTECSARLQRQGAFLLVEDNNRCGQRFVSFTGLYRRR